MRISRAFGDGETAVSLWRGDHCAAHDPVNIYVPAAGIVRDAFAAKLDKITGQANIKPEEIADAICSMITNQAVSGEIWADAGWHPAAA